MWTKGIIAAASLLLIAYVTTARESNGTALEESKASPTTVPATPPTTRPTTSPAELEDIVHYAGTVFTEPTHGRPGSVEEGTVLNPDGTDRRFTVRMKVTRTFNKEKPGDVGQSERKNVNPRVLKGATLTDPSHSVTCYFRTPAEGKVMEFEDGDVIQVSGTVSSLQALVPAKPALAKYEISLDHCHLEALPAAANPATQPATRPVSVSPPTRPAED